MKKSKLFGWSLAAIMTSAGFSACTNDVKEMDASNNEIKLTSTITPESRAGESLQSTQIVSGQHVGVTITGAKDYHNNASWLVGADGALTNTGSALYWGNSNVNITAYHPYTSDWTGESHTFSVEQDQSIDQNYINSDLLFAKSENVTKTDAAIPLTFSHKLAKIKVTLSSEDIDDLSGATICICGTKTSVSFNPQTGELLPDTESDEAEITVGGTPAAAAIIIPQTVSGNTKFIKVTHNGKTYYYKLTANQTFDSGKVYEFALNVKEKATELLLKSNNITDWTEYEDEFTGDAEEESTSVIIENPALSQVLLDVLGAENVTINNDNFAVLDESYVLGVTSLALYESENLSNITTLEGIEHFKNLTDLTCGRPTSLTTCDISQNTKLTLFSIEFSSVTELDFSNNPNLEIINCPYNENLSIMNLTGCNVRQLDLSGNTALTTATITIPDDVKQNIEYLLYYETSLEFDLNDFTSLKGLAFGNMNLTTLDNFIPETTMTRLDKLICVNCQLTTLDLSKFPNLTELNCCTNQITELNLTNCPNLQYLRCYGNRISALDITSLSNLNSLGCGVQTDENSNDITLTLTLTSTQQTLWNESWSSYGENSENITLNVIDAQ